MGASNLEVILDSAIRHTEKIVTLAINQKGFLRRIEIFGYLRVHFFESLEDECYAHNHKQMFSASVLLGGYDHTVYKSSEDGTSQQIYVKTRDGYIQTERRATISKERTDRIRQNCGYLLGSEVLHSLSKLMPDTTTLFVKSMNPALANEDPIFLMDREPVQTADIKLSIEETRYLLFWLKMRLFPCKLNIKEEILRLHVA